MPFTIITTSNARRDIEDAIEWENKRKPGLARRFLEDLDKKLTSVSITPGLGSIRSLYYYKSVFIYHQLHCKRYPPANYYSSGFA